MASAAPLDRLFSTLGLERTALPSPIDATIRPGELAARTPSVSTVPGGRDRGPSRTAPFLPSITLSDGQSGAPEGRAGADLVVGGLLGEGGMGVVHRAEQRSLDRVVAIKRPTGAGLELVEEARTMARVEHPNVVPVHALGRDAAEKPVLVMKRVAGASLRTLLADDAHPAWPPLVERWGGREEAALGILAEVADALSLAHARGIVHRDVKPENVMVGEFGEVYLLDWGIACEATGASVLENGEGALDGNIVGTPGFMAPEMVLAPGAVDARTDVYLLGATLHQVLTRTLRHRGESLYATLGAAIESAPYAYGPEVPEDLAALANAATAADPEARPPTAAAFRRALQEHARHREALALVGAARAALAPIGGEVGAETPRAGELLAEAGAALAAAARSFPDGAAVLSARIEHRLASIERELAVESPRAARAHVEAIEALGGRVPETVRERLVRLEETVAARAASEAELARRSAEAEVAGGMGIRIAVLAGATLVFFALSMLLSLDELGGGGPMTMRQVVQTDVVVCVLLATGLFVFRARLLANQGNRRLSAYGLGGLVAVGCSNAVSWALGHAPAVGIAHANLLWAAYFVAGAAMLERRLLGPALSSSAAVVALVIRPDLLALISPVAMITSITLVLAALRGHARDAAPRGR